MYGTGYISTSPKPDLSGSGTARLMIAWGKVTKAPEFMKWKKQKVSVSIAIAKGEYQTVVAWEDSPNAFDALSCLEKGDTVLILGTRADKPFKNRNGETKESHDLTADIVIPQAVINEVIHLISNPAVARLMQQGMDEYADYDDQPEQGDDGYESAPEPVDDGYEGFTIDMAAEDVPFR